MKSCDVIRSVRGATCITYPTARSRSSIFKTSTTRRRSSACRHFTLAAVCHAAAAAAADAVNCVESKNITYNGVLFTELGWVIDEGRSTKLKKKTAGTTS